MKISNLFKEKLKRRRKPVNPIALAIIVFVFAAVAFNVYNYNQLKPKQLYYIENLDISFPIIYQIRNERKLNEMRGFTNSNYSKVSNDTVTLLGQSRKLDLLIKNNGNRFNYLEYEVRDRTSNRLLERTRFDIDETAYNKEKDETRITLNIQNLITGYIHFQ